MSKIVNPIIPGFNPDPSICAVGDDFYLVTSTFEYFPGVPVYHSRNLVNWELIGHCLTRESQIPLRGCRCSGGVYAPTLRHHDGRFFMIGSNEGLGGIFIVHAEDVRGEWSEPVRVDQWGIDPSLFWDDDGTCYFTSTNMVDGMQGIVAFKINPFTGEILSRKHDLSRGCGGKYPEAPHLYKKDGYYYLMVAEGGTEYGHHETIQRSREVFGVYEPCPDNPILSHAGIRGQGAPIQATGHADLVRDRNGRYWLVCLGIRQFGFELLHNLGRETFLAPVAWEDGGWPCVGDQGMIAPVFEAELPAEPSPVEGRLEIPFNGELSKHFLFVRNPMIENYKMEQGRLTLLGEGTALDEEGASPTLLGIRQPAFCTVFRATIDLRQSKGKRYGVSAYYNHGYHYDLHVTNEEDGTYLCFYKHVHDFGAELKRTRIEADTVTLCVETDKREYRFHAEVPDGIIPMGSGHIAGLCTEGTMMMTFTGTLLTVFCEEGKAVFLDALSLEQTEIGLSRHH